MNKLIIGKNSKVVKSLKALGETDNCGLEFISHKDIDNANLDIYSMIWLFSWNKKCWKENLDLISKLPIEKLVFISSQSVYSIQKFNQPYKYVIDKLKAEEFIIKNGGCVVRIASIDHEISKKLQKYAFTNSKDLLKLIKSSNSVTKFPKISNFFEVIVRPPSKKNWTIRLVNRLQYFRKYKLINILHAIVSKYIFQTVPYGYTKDANDFVADRIFIGFGCLASFAFKNRVTYNDTIFVSNKNDKMIKNCGFNGTFVGLSKKGLSSRWHGVNTTLIENNRVEKEVAIFPFRAKLAGTNNIYLRNVQKISHNGKLWEIFTEKGEIHFANQVILGAGWFENIRLLSCLQPIATILADDENAIIGTLSLHEAIQAKLIRKKFVFTFAGHGLYLSHKSFPAFIEARLPLSSGKTSEIFHDTPIKIMWGLLKSMNASKINNAFFNKFGCGLSLNSKLNIFITIFNPNSTKVVAKNGEIREWRRNRVAYKLIEEINSDLSMKFKTYTPMRDIELSDGMHYSGGIDKLSDELKAYISKNTLHVLGVPNRKKNNPFHNTLSLMNKYRNKYSSNKNSH